MTLQPFFLVGISNCRQWVILVVVEHMYISTSSSLASNTCAAFGQ
jgi:hypothetical protein